MMIPGQVVALNFWSARINPDADDVSFAIDALCDGLSAMELCKLFIHDGHSLAYAVAVKRAARTAMRDIQAEEV